MEPIEAEIMVKPIEKKKMELTGKKRVRQKRDGMGKNTCQENNEKKPWGKTIEKRKTNKQTSKRVELDWSIAYVYLLLRKRFGVMTFSK